MGVGGAYIVHRKQFFFWDGEFLGSKVMWIRSLRACGYHPRDRHGIQFVDFGEGYNCLGGGGDHVPEPVPKKMDIRIVR